jgi:ribosomal-protein-alanine N-acetyltransferase
LHDPVESRRLLLRHYQPSDLDELFPIHSDPRVGRYTFSPRDPSEAAEHYEAGEAACTTHGVAPWVARLRDDGRAVGYGGLLVDAFESGWGIEIVYFIAPEYWGQGFASELAGCAVDHAFRTLCLAELAAFTRPENRASRRVLEKLGFEWRAHVPALERDHFILETR